MRPFTVCGTLFNGDMEGVMEWVVTHLEWEKSIYRQRRWVSYKPGMLYFLEVPIRKCSFPAPGRYELTCSIDGTQLAQRYFDVLRQKG